MVNFNFSYAPGTSLQQMVGFETAGRVWSSFLTDNVTVNIYAGVSSSLPKNVIGGALPGIRAEQSYSSVVNGLVKDVTSADDITAVNSLNRGDDYTAQFDMSFGWGSTNLGVVIETDDINLTTANAKAIGLVSVTNSALDGVVLFGGLQGTGYAWNYDYARSGSAPANSLDFLSTAIHEIGHILGFVSGVDKPGWLNGKVDFSDMDDYIENLEERIEYTTPLDLFRYSRNFSGINDLSYGSSGGQSDKFFSIDRGRTAIASFATGSDTSLGGDGDQASHWKDGTPGIMDPSLALGERLSVSRTDLRAFDAIGWNLKSTTGSLNVDLSALKSQSDQALAQRLKTTVASLYADGDKSAAKLSTNETGAVSAMIKDSQVYDWGVKTKVIPTLLPAALSQVVSLLQNETVYGSFGTLDDEATSIDSIAPSVSAVIKGSQPYNQITKSPVTLPSLDWGFKPPVTPTPIPPFLGVIVGLLPEQVLQSVTSVAKDSDSVSSSSKSSLSQDLIEVDTVDVLAL